MIKMKSTAIIGAGGIGSYVIMHLRTIVKELMKKDSMNDDSFNYKIKIFDDDTIEEKNILGTNQNFVAKDIMEYKAMVLSQRYGCDFENIIIDENNINKLDEFDSIILCVDNHKTRKLIYGHCIRKGKYLLDLRAEGTRWSYFVIDKIEDNKKEEVIEKYNKRFFSNDNVMKIKSGCQLDTDIENNHIENANKVVAFYGIYCIFLKHLRDEDIASKELELVY